MKIQRLEKVLRVIRSFSAEYYPAPEFEKFEQHLLAEINKEKCALLMNKENKK